MNYNTIKPNDVSNGKGVCVSLYVQGCEHYCKDCFNKETWDFSQGKQFTFGHYRLIKELLTKNGIQRDLCILGGEPLHPENIITVYALCKYIKYELPQTLIYLWTGYKFEDLDENQLKKIRPVDILIDGKFETDLKDITLKMRGSSNQRIINVKETLKTNEVKILDEYDDFEYLRNKREK